MQGANRRAGLFLKYFAFIGLLVSVGLVASGAIGLYFSYQETRNSLQSLQREKALTAAVRIEHFLRDVEAQLGWTTLPLVTVAKDPMEHRRLDYIKLQRQAPAITEISYLDAKGHEQLRISRLAMDVVGSNVDYSKDPRFVEARKGKTWFGPVYFRKDTEPYMTIAIPEAPDRPGVTAVEVNLKFIWDVVSRIRIGEKGVAYVVDDKGFLVAHPDISLVLRKVNLSNLPQVKSALAQKTDFDWQPPPDSHDLDGKPMLAAYAPVEAAGWRVFVEEPTSEVLAPLYAAILRTVFLLLAGVALSIVASVFLARRMVQPVRELQRGAERIGAGDLTSSIDVRTGDELEDLARRFNTMTGQLRESYADLEKKVETRTAELREALDQQTATADVLKVISQSTTDVIPVFEAIVRSARDLGEAFHAYAYRYDGERIHYVTSTDAREEFLGLVRDRPSWEPSQSTMSGRVILARRTMQIEDMNLDPDYSPRPGKPGSITGERRLLGVPMMRDGEPIGVLTVSWIEAGTVPPKFIRLLETFAAQAVIAIENVRLFNETTDALEQQTATADVLKVISQSTTDVKPVFEAIVASARELGAAEYASVFRYEAGKIHFVASTDRRPQWRAFIEGRAPWSPDRASMTGRVVTAKSTVAIEDIHADPEYRVEDRDLWRDHHRLLGVPMMREGEPIGVLLVGWKEAGPVPEKFTRLLETFAAQAVIAIENVRLFNETKEALDRQTATADILRTINATSSDLTPVFAAIAAAAKRLGGARAVVVSLYEEGLIRFVATDPPGPVASTVPDRSSLAGRVVLAKAPVEITDLDSDPDYDPARKLTGTRRSLGIPMLRDGEVIGTINVAWDEPGPIAEKFKQVLQTFADQAVIAIENVRLFNEIQEKSRQLEIANKHKSDFLANVSHELRTPLNAIIGFSDVMLAGMAGELPEKQQEFTRDIRDSGKHLLGLINDILDLSKIEAGRMELDLSRFDVRTAMENAMTLVKGRAERHGINLETNIDAAVGEYEGDERKFKQIMLNLLTNAVKFTPEGGTVTMSAGQMNGSYVFSVTDTGIGIAPEDHGRIFEEFRQVGTDYQRKAEGTGLGLTLTKKLIELHGGSIRLESALGKGSVFTFNLPLEHAPQ